MIHVGVKNIAADIFFLLLLDIFPRQKLSQAMKSTVRGRQKQTVEQHDKSTLPTVEILSGKNVRAWVSMV